MGMVEGAIVTLVMERDLTVWAIGFDSRLIAAVYSVIKHRFIKQCLQISFIIALLIN